MKRLALAAVLLLILTSCQTYDPRKDADAYATRRAADQNALNQEQTRQQSQDLHELEVTRQNLEIEQKQATAKQWVNAKRIIITAFGWSAGIGIFVAVLMTAVSYSLSTYGVARATMQGAELRANLIYADPATGLFPMLRHVHGNKYYLANGSTGSILQLDVTQPADRQLIAAYQVIAATGVLANASAESKDPAGVALINPPIVHTQTEEITLGSTFAALPGESS